MTKPSNIEAWLAELGKPAADRDYNPGHERMLALLADATLQRPGIRIRVAGTNGKGSTSFMLAHALQASGLRVGLYTSPHILRFNERIRVNLEPISDEALHQQLQAVMPAARASGASYFEVATAVALQHFSEQSVDVEILEAGVGARLDATTAIAADVALITPIALDHQAWLGDTLDDIAAEKAHVTNGCHLALSAPQSPDVATVIKHACPAIEFVSADAWQGKLNAVGEHQRINAGLAWKACQRISETLLPDIDPDRAHAAINHCTIPGRLQSIRIGNARVWLDAAHNRHAIEALITTLPELADPLDTIIVRSREDRSLADALDLLRPCARTLMAGSAADDAWSCLQQAIAEKPDGRFLVLGSFTTVAAIQQHL